MKYDKENLDPVLVWLRANDMIVSENKEAGQFEINCVLRVEDEDGGDDRLYSYIGSYSPLGYGEKPWERSYGFDDVGLDFLDSVSWIVGLRATKSDPLPWMLAKFALIVEKSRVLDLEDGHIYTKREWTDMLANLIIHLPRTYERRKARDVAATDMWLKSEKRITLRGTGSGYGDTDRVIFKENGFLYANTSFVPE